MADKARSAVLFSLLFALFTARAKLRRKGDYTARTLFATPLQLANPPPSPPSRGRVVNGPNAKVYVKHENAPTPTPA